MRGKVSPLQALREAGQAIFGEQWVSPIARALGPLHPRGGRERIDVRLVQHWQAETVGRRVPDWVPDALARLLFAEAGNLRGRAVALERLAERIAPPRSGDPEPGPTD